MYVYSIKEFKAVIKMFNQTGTKQGNLFDMKISNDEYERKAVCNYINRTEQAYPDESKDMFEIITLRLQDDEIFKDYFFCAQKTDDLKTIKLLTQSFFNTGEMPQIN